MNVSKDNNNKVISIEKNLPHIVQIVICLHCLHRWVSVRPEMTPLKDLECPECGKIGGVIGTGDILDNT